MRAKRFLVSLFVGALLFNLLSENRWTAQLSGGEMASTASPLSLLESSLDAEIFGYDESFVTLFLVFFCFGAEGPSLAGICVE